MCASPAPDVTRVVMLVRGVTPGDLDPVVVGRCTRGRGGQRFDVRSSVVGVDSVRVSDCSLFHVLERDGMEVSEVRTIVVLRLLFLSGLEMARVLYAFSPHMQPSEEI
jgi:hypothetical protein